MNRIILISIIIIIIIIAGIFIYYEIPHYNIKTISAQTDSSSNPSIEIKAIFKNNFTLGQIIRKEFHAVVISPVPLFLGSGHHEISNLNQTNNAFEVILFQKSVYNNDTLRGLMNPLINTIFEEWKSIASKNTLNVSLTLYSDYIIQTNDTLYVYQYFDNIPYSLDRLPNQFNATSYFDLSHPSFTFKIGSSSNIQPQLTCAPNTNCQTTTTIVNQTTITGPLPLMVAAINNTSQSYLAYDFASLQGSIELSFTSASASSSNKPAYSITEISTQPSWSGTDNNFSYVNIPAAAYPTNLANISMIYIPDVTYNAVELRTDYYALQGTCYVYLGSVYSTSISVVSIVNNNFNPKINYLRNLANSPYWFQVINSISFTNTYTINLAPNSYIDYVTYTQYATGYTSVADALNTALNAVSIAVSSIGFGLAIADALSILPGAGTAADAISLINLSLAGVGLDLSIISAFSSIMYSTNAKLTFNSVGLSNLPNPYTDLSNNLIVYLYQATNQSFVVINGNTYYFNSPFTYIYANI